MVPMNGAMQKQTGGAGEGSGFGERLAASVLAWHQQNYRSLVSNMVVAIIVTHAILPSCGFYLSFITYFAEKKIILFGRRENG